jgi:hypothetical protein
MHQYPDCTQYALIMDSLMYKYVNSSGSPRNARPTAFGEDAGGRTPHARVPLALLMILSPPVRRSRVPRQTDIVQPSPLCAGSRSTRNPSSINDVGLS